MLPSLSWQLSYFRVFRLFTFLSFLFFLFSIPAVRSSPTAGLVPVPGSTAPRLRVGNLPSQLFLHGSPRFRGPRLCSWNFAHSSDFVTPAVPLRVPRFLVQLPKTLWDFCDSTSTVRYIRTRESLNAYGLIFTLCVFGHFWVSPAVHKNTFFYFAKP